MKKFDRSASMTLDTLETIKEIKDFFEECGAPDDATFDVHVSKGDRPWEGDQTTIKVRW